MHSSEFTSISDGDHIGIDHASNVISVARVQKVSENEIKAWVLNGDYEIVFDRKTGLTIDYGMEARIAFAGQFPDHLAEIVEDLNAKRSVMSLRDIEAFCAAHMGPVLEFMNIEHDPALRAKVDWSPKPRSSREGDQLWRQAKEAQLSAKIGEVNKEASLKLADLQQQADDLGIGFR